MRFGLFGSAQARRPVPGAELTDSSQGFREWIENNVAAEALGFHSTFVVEHHFTGYGQVSATINLLTWLGARTSTLRLGTAVMVLPWHNPVLLAEQAATIDLLSGGRLDFGVGKGYRHNEFVGFCIPMEEADALCDALAILHLGKIAAVGKPAQLKNGLGPGATLNDVFAHYSGGTIQEEGNYRDVRQARRTANRLG